MTTSAFAPGSVTTAFVPRQDHDEGSLGVSFAVADGVTVTIDQATTTTITLDGANTDIEAVTNVLDRLDCDADVDVVSEVPIGCGFGVSGAATLATALATAAEYDLDTPRDTLVEAAHHAELDAGTGQGDVFIQAQGGLVYNTGDGIGHTSRDDTIAYASNGSIDTAAILADADASDRITAAGRPTLAAFDPETSLDAWFSRCWTFAQEAGLTTDWINDTVETVEAAGGSATMALFGDTVVGTPGTDVLPTETQIHPYGATIQ